LWPSNKDDRYKFFFCKLVDLQLSHIFRQLIQDLKYANTGGIWCAYRDLQQRGARAMRKLCCA
jgi:hypothetical protein